MKFSVPGMDCGHCTAAIKKGIAEVDPNATVQTDLETHTVTVTSTVPPFRSRRGSSPPATTRRSPDETTYRAP